MSKKKVSSETLKALNGLRSEIIAGKVLVPKTNADRAWNDCADRAVGILNAYRRGEGLFQL